MRAEFERTATPAIDITSVQIIASGLGVKRHYIPSHTASVRALLGKLAI